MDPLNFVRNGEAVGRLEGFSAPLVAGEAIRWLKSRPDSSAPFFLTVWTHEPHEPIESDPQFMEAYRDIEEEGIRQHHGNVTQMDHAFGLVMGALDELKLAQNTLVIFTADNGPEGTGMTGRTRGSTGGLRGRKRHSHEGGIRVPGIVRWPGRVQPGSISSEPVIGSDIFTTVCDVLDIPLPKDRPIDGASFLPILSGQPIQRTEPLYWRNHLAPDEYKTALRIGDWKLVGSDDLTRFELYNLREDEKESADLSAKYPEKFKELKQALIAQDKEVLAEGPDWWKNEPPPKPAAKKKKRA
jgi:arylsulfatase A